MYENIQNAMSNPQCQTPKLTPQEQAENYDLFDKMMKSGVSLKGLLDKISDLEKKVDKLTIKPAINEDLFAVMEQSVRKCPEVAEAKQNLDRMMKTVLTEICMKDPRFSKCAEDYRTVVNKAYVEKNEKTVE